MKTKKNFVVIDFDWVPGIFDYPQNIPLPKVGEKIQFETDQCKACQFGIVTEIKHMINYSISEIRIIVKRDE